MHVSRLDDSVSFAYLVHALRMANLNQYSSASGQPLVSGSRIYPVRILVPPMDVQTRFGANMAAVASIRERQRAFLWALTPLNAALYSHAFAGQT